MIESTTLAGFPGLSAKASGASRGTAVFLHGAFGDHTAFGPFMERFARAGWDGFAFSRRGRHGVGARGAAGVTMNDYLDDTRAVLDALARPVVLVGHSLGGLLAQVLAAEGRARAQVLVASAPPGMLTAQPIALPHFAPKLLRIFTGRDFMVSEKAVEVLALNAMPDASERKRILATFVPESGLVYRAMMMGSVRVDATKVTCPTLVVAGGDDRIISGALSRKTAKHYGAPLVTHAGHAHWILEEPGADRIADEIVEWLAQNENGKSSTKM